MDTKKGGGNGTQTWRAMSTQPNYSQGDGERAKLKNPLGEVHHAISSSTSIATCGSSNSEILNEKHSVSMEIGASLMRFVKGKWGNTQKKLEEENGIKIIFPPSRTEDSITIEGNSVECVTQASEKIQSLLDEIVNSRDLDYSHFISLPLAFHPELVDKLLNFQNTVLDIAPSDGSTITDLGIEKSIFINPKTFHLTVLMLKLWNYERLKTAAEVLQSVSSKVLDALENRPVSIGLKGLECMKGSRAKAYVVYAPVEVIGGEERLLRACKVIKDAFIEAGLVMEKDVQQKLKLHATLMNARHRKRYPRTRNENWFDARHIFEMYGSEEWGEYPIHQAHLSERFVHDDNGYYRCYASIPFPDACQ